MRRKSLPSGLLWMLTMTLLLAGCPFGGGEDENAESNANANTDNNNPLNIDTSRVDVEEYRDSLREEIEDRVDCSGILRQETREQLVSRVREQEFDPGRLLTSPSRVASTVAAAAVTLDSTALLVANLVQMTRVGHIKAVMSEGWDGLVCGEELTFACEDLLGGDDEGMGSTTVRCGPNDAIEAVELDYGEGCRLAGTLNKGKVQFLRQGQVFGFEGFELGSLRQIDGQIKVLAQAGEPLHLALDTGGELTVATNAGKSCEERLTIRALDLQQQGEQLQLTIDLDRLKDEKTWGLGTPSGAVTWQFGSGCSCPQPGGAFELRVPEPLGEPDETARMRLDFGQGEQGAFACRSLDLSLTDWPTDCGVQSVVNCGKDATESLLEPLLQPLCPSF